MEALHVGRDERKAVPLLEESGEPLVRLDGAVTTASSHKRQTGLNRELDIAAAILESGRNFPGRLTAHAA